MQLLRLLFAILLTFAITSPAHAVPAWCKLAYENQELVIAGLTHFRSMSGLHTLPPAVNDLRIQVLITATFGEGVTADDVAKYIRHEPWLDSFLDVAERIDTHYWTLTFISDAELQNGKNMLGNNPDGVIKLFEPRFKSAIQAGSVFLANPNFVTAMSFYMHALSARGRLTEAHEIADFTIEANEKQPSLKDYEALIRYENGRAYHKENSFQAAIQEFEHALEIDPYSLELYDYLGVEWLELANKLPRSRLESMLNAMDAYIQLYVRIQDQQHAELEAHAEKTYGLIAKKIFEEYQIDATKIVPHPDLTRPSEDEFRKMVRAAVQIAKAVKNPNALSDSNRHGTLHEFYTDIVALALGEINDMAEFEAVLFKKNKMIPILEFIVRFMPDTEENEIYRDLLEEYDRLP